jgi:XTP/dITP diphosphohydrolase
MKEILFVTNNKHKLHEIRQILKDKFVVISLNDIGFKGEIPETNPTIKDNAIQKAKFIYDRYGIDCFADDTGLIVPALNGEPGVYSARYAGENATFEDNMNLLLKKMENIQDRYAYFITVIALFLDGKLYTFEGRVDGNITDKPQGDKGFGYDPVFLPAGMDKTFAEMTAEEKNLISHRGIATRKLAEFLISI